MKIALVSTTRYPTEKAYGVTIQHTCKALRDIGHQAQIYNPNFVGKDDSGNEVYEIMTQNLSKLFVKRLLQGHRIVFAFRSIILGAKFKMIATRNKFNIIWLRDIFFAATLRCLGVKVPILIEIHHIPNGASLRILRWLSSKNTAIATLTNSHQQILEKQGFKGPICISPMGVPSDFFIHPNLKKNLSSDEFGYVGKATSSGISNQLDALVREFQLAQDQDTKLELTMVGLEQSAITTLEALQNKDTSRYRPVVFIGNVKHAEVINFLSMFYCGLLPYVDSQYNSMRFPIKLLEYAASSTHIIASDIQAHRDLLSDSQATFYNPEIKGSLAEAILYIRANEDEVDKKILEAYAWAENFSYENRVRQGLKCISDLEID